MLATKIVPLSAPGFQFLPTDRMLVGYFLHKKLCGEYLPPGLIPEINLYSDHPARLTTQFDPQNRYSEWYFFTSSSHPSYEAGSGRWNSTQPMSDFDADGIEGTKQSFAYFEKTAKGEEDEKPTKWVMDEYTIKKYYSSGSAKDSNKLNDWMICKVKRKSRVREEAAVPGP